MLSAIRVNINEGTQYSPFRLMYAREPVLPLDNLLKPRRRYLGETYSEIIWEEMHKAHLTMQRNRKIAFERTKKYADRNARLVEFEVGEKVLYRNHVKQSKFDYEWIKGYTIVEKYGQSTYLIKNQMGGRTLVTSAEHLIRDLETISEEEEPIWRGSTYALPPEDTEDSDTYSSDSNNSATDVQSSYEISTDMTDVFEQEENQNSQVVEEKDHSGVTRHDLDKLEDTQADTSTEQKPEKVIEPQIEQRKEEMETSDQELRTTGSLEESEPSINTGLETEDSNHFTIHIDPVERQEDTSSDVRADSSDSDAPFRNTRAAKRRAQRTNEQQTFLAVTPQVSTLKASQSSAGTHALVNPEEEHEVRDVENSTSLEKVAEAREVNQIKEKLCSRNRKEARNNKVKDVGKIGTGRLYLKDNIFAEGEQEKDISRRSPVKHAQATFRRLDRLERTISGTMLPLLALHPFSEEDTEIDVSKVKSREEMEEIREKGICNLVESMALLRL